MFPDEILTTTDDTLLISCLGLAEEVDSRDPAHPVGGNCIGVDVLTVAVEKEDRSEEEECK